MDKLTDIDCDILLNRYDRLKSTKILIKSLAKFKNKDINNNFAKSDFENKNYAKYKLNFLKFLQENNIRNFSDKKILEHYKSKFIISKTNKIKKTKIFWAWISICCLLFAAIIIIIILTSLKVI